MSPRPHIDCGCGNAGAIPRPSSFLRARPARHDRTPGIVGRNTDARHASRTCTGPDRVPQTALHARRDVARSPRTGYAARAGRLRLVDPCGAPHLVRPIRCGRRSGVIQSFGPRARGEQQVERSPEHLHDVAGRNRMAQHALGASILSCIDFGIVRCIEYRSSSGNGRLAPGRVDPPPGVKELACSPWSSRAVLTRRRPRAGAEPRGCSRSSWLHSRRGSSRTHRQPHSRFRRACPRGRSLAPGEMGQGGE